jgi:hypothetical protein
MDLSNILPPERAPDEGLDDCIGKAHTENSLFSMKMIGKALNISSTTMQNHLTTSSGMKYYHM